jgi:hypothetical protein
MRIVRYTKKDRDSKDIFPELRRVTIKENATFEDWRKLQEKARRRAIPADKNSYQVYKYLYIGNKEIKGLFSPIGYVKFKLVK